MVPGPRHPPGYSLCHSLILVPPFPRNYVFQRRFVQFNGRSLMYFGSDKVGMQGFLHEAWGQGGLREAQDWKVGLRGAVTT